MVVDVDVVVPLTHYHTVTTPPLWFNPSNCVSQFSQPHNSTYRTCPPISTSIRWLPSPFLIQLPSAIHPVRHTVTHKTQPRDYPVAATSTLQYLLPLDYLFSPQHRRPILPRGSPGTLIPRQLARYYRLFEATFHLTPRGGRTSGHYLPTHTGYTNCREPTVLSFLSQQLPRPLLSQVTQLCRNPIARVPIRRVRAQQPQHPLFQSQGCWSSKTYARLSLSPSSTTTSSTCHDSLGRL